MASAEQMGKQGLMGAILKLVYGPDAEMAHPRSQEAAKAVVEERPAPAEPSKEEVRAKIQEASEAVDHAREATDRLARMPVAKNVDEALRQLTRGER